MVKKLIFALLFVIVSILVFWTGYETGAFHQQALDAPSKARLVARMTELYEQHDERAYSLMLTYLDTELSFYEGYLEDGMPLLARYTHHSYFIEQEDGHLKAIARFIHSTNDGSNKYKQDVADRLTRIGYPPDDAPTRHAAQPD